ncbi:hypothetical protein L9F63_014936, partial [Diploptera punctata]
CRCQLHPVVGQRTSKQGHAPSNTKREQQLQIFLFPHAAHVWSEKHNINSDTKLLKQLENTKELTILEKNLYSEEQKQSYEF